MEEYRAFQGVRGGGYLEVVVREKRIEDRGFKGREREETGKGKESSSEPINEGPHSSRPDDPTDSALVPVLELVRISLSFFTLSLLFLS